jgi:hypothetical protein
MAWISNIWEHPKTSAAGVLIAIATVAGVLVQQSITLGTAGTGTVVSLIGALATALLGLLAKDPSDSGSTSGTTIKQGIKLGTVLALAALVPALTLAGCTVTSSQLQNDAVALSSALTSLSAALSTSDADAAAKLEVAAESLNAIANHWDSSSSAGLLNTAAAGVETVLGSISSTSKYAALVAIAVAAVDVILANTSTTNTQAARLTEAQSKQLGVARAVAAKLLTHRLGRTPAGDFKAAWNRAIVAENLPLQPLR